MCHVHQLRHNLLSVKLLCHDNNCHVIFNANSVSIKDNTMGEVLLQASSVGNVYPIRLESEHLHANLALNESGDTWRRRLGHCGWNVLNLLKKIKLFTDTCTICRLLKSCRLPFTLIEHRATVPLELIHSDVVFVDDLPRFT